MADALRVLFDAGPGNAAASLAAFAARSANASISHQGYSDQLYQVCDDLRIPLLALCNNADAVDLECRDIKLERCDDPLQHAHGIGYYVAHAQRAAQLLAKARQFRANVIIIPNEPHPALMVPARHLGIRIVQALHCVLWPVCRAPRVKDRVLLRGMRGAYRSGLSAVLAVSSGVSAQVEQVAAGSTVPIVEFLPTFRPEMFTGTTSPLELPRSPFRVMFIGRLEANKGAFTVLDVAHTLRAQGHQDIVFDVCGDGDAMAEAQRMVAERGLAANVTLHGWCDAARLKQIADKCHTLIVPTRSDFTEGFNKTVVEALLYGRPVVVSRACPALDYVSGVALPVDPDDVEGYARAILTLAKGPDTLERMCQAVPAAASLFLQDGHSYASAMHHILAALGRGERPTPRRIAIGNGHDPRR